MRLFVDIGLSRDSQENFIKNLKDCGYILLTGSFPYGKWLYSAMNDDRLIDKDSAKEIWYGQGTEVNEVGEKFLILVDYDEKAFRTD